MTQSEMWTIFECCLSASKRSMSHEQIEFLLKDRIRAEYFEAVMGLA